jgi:hypothetical protein
MNSTQAKSQSTLTLAQQARAALQLMPIDVPEDALQFETEGPTLDRADYTSWRVDLETATATVEGERHSIPDLYASLFKLSDEEAESDIRKALHEADAMPEPADEEAGTDAPPTDTGAETPHEDTEAAVFELQGKVSTLQREAERWRRAALQAGVDPSEVQEADALSDEPGADERLGWHTDPEPLSGCEHLPDSVFSDLPAPLHEATRFFDAAHKRDVFLMAALGRLSAVLPNVVGYWGNDMPEALGPNLYSAIVAGASGGKGAAGFARSLTQPVHDAIRKESSEAQEDWQERKRDAKEADEPFDEPKPPGQYLHIPMNASASKLIEMLAANEERGLLTTSEIDTLTDTIGQDWGKISPMLRKAYHHEPDGQARKGDGVQHLDEPHLSLVMVGTDRQFARLIQSPEDGLFSRISLYYFDAASPYRSQQPTSEGIKRLEQMEGMGSRILDLWQMLRGRTEPLQFKPAPDHWQGIQQHFAPLHYEVQARGFGDLISIARRAGLWSFRMAMTLAVLRAHAEGASLRSIDTLTPADADVSAALDIASTCADHALRFARAKLNAAEPASPKDNRIALMLKNVGDIFSSSEAYAAAKGEGVTVTNRTLRNDLKTAARRGLINSLGERSGWKKAR